ncbi:MAG TPA: chromosomal replication initiator protein DnaA [Dongiaceae bacterium]
MTEEVARVPGVDSVLAGQWAQVRGRLRSEFGEATYRSWLKPLTLLGQSDCQVSIAVKTRFMRDWISQHYAERIRALWHAANPEVRGIEFVVDGSRPQAMKAQQAERVAPHTDTMRAEPMRAEPLRAESGRAEPMRESARADAPATFAPEDVSAPLDPRFTFENFVVGKSNELAHAAAQRVAEARAVPFNPLFLYGGVGLGKTHLMHAVAWHIKKRTPQRRVIYLSAEKFMYQFIRSLRQRNVMAFKEQFRSVDVLMIDDVQFISGKDSTQEEFFHTFNALVDQNRQVVISADKSPHDLEGLEERMRSRLGWGLVADIHPTTYELRLGILQSKAEQMKAQVPSKVLEFLAHKIVSNIRELEGALNRIVAHATLIGRSITLETTQEVLHDLLRANDRRVTIEEIQRRVAEHFNMKLADMHSERRARAVARPRQVAMYLSKQLTTRSLPEIGRKFGNRDHTTVMHAVRKIEELCALDAGFSEDVELLRRMLEG